MNLKLSPLLFFFVFTSVFSQNNKKIVEQAIQKYKNHRSISYALDYSIKVYDDQKPSRFNNEKVKIIRLKDDTIFGGIICYESKFKTNNNVQINDIKYYNGSKLYIINRKDSLIIQFNPAAGQTWPIKARYDGAFINTYFIRPNGLKNALQNKENKISITDTSNLVRIKIRYPDGQYSYNMEKDIYIDKSTKNIEKITFQAQYENQIQKEIWELSHIVFDSVTKESINSSLRAYFQDFEMKEYKPKPDEYYDLMANGETAPPIKGNLFPDYTDEIKINFDKITVLDFWYTACLPCIKAIPQLNKLKEKYEDKIKIVGVNDIEFKPEQEGTIKAFLERTPIDYKIFLTKKIPEKYNIRAYPTIYIIGKDGKVKYAHTDYSKDMLENLSKIIDRLTK